MNYQFPEYFCWGSAASATQTEGAAFSGGKGENIWDHWFKEQPNRFHNSVSATDASTFYENYQSDIKLMKEIGHNSFRTSISWARLLPEGTGEVNQQAVDFYNNVIDELIANEIEPFICLYHFDMPLAMQNIGGFENREVLDAYASYAELCFKLFGDRVKHWFTFNEPIVPVEGGYLYDFHYPNVVDFKRAATVAYHTIIAHSKAVGKYRAMECDGQIGIILNLTPSYPRSQHPADLKASNICDLMFNRSFLDPAVKGEYPQELIELLTQYDQMPTVLDGDCEIIVNGKVDVLGVNYYQPRRVKARENAVHPEAPFMPEFFFDYYEMPGRKMNPHRGWEIYEKGIYDILTNLRENYGNLPCYISENGMGVEGEEKFLVDGQIQDDYRIDFIRGHLEWLHKGIEEGSACFGYHLWTFIDNWSWSNAYKNRYGFYQLDLQTQKRSVKKSGEWFAEISANNGF
ncbi:6-phospho-beta-glucosidase [Vibrio vulnificus]|uniref:glycoside hydrolase family 1 protein n=1 Tax=Vibrio vulnificus TaxID=672 RepID=UPI000BA8A777|nr:glycoside hydrolase family 1 protein [Vibrio vulnificus]PAO30006.1 6-phospho-beta-glucosidase [Vibrio vulnificus]PAO42418.1 6-phospho-beta-glucosidase [Vibrio vulnificus]PAO47207.1 6-phospho-beta-glucosidase [Vibrio vulnificus]PAO50867.1 6-phospho-beta-glucosidase [Vibrio vulnificus]PAO59135.1 6-phospho-beta-glucosidase [Vibrio vulnificus]